MENPIGGEWRKHTRHIKILISFCEPIWYYDANIKAPEDQLQKVWFLGTSGDDLTYKVMTEKGNNKKHDVVLIQSLLKSRCKNIGKETEYVNDDPKYADFYLTPPAESNQHPSDSRTQPQHNHLFGYLFWPYCHARNTAGTAAAVCYNLELL